MSVVSEWSNRCCFVWAVQRPLSGRCRYSPKFTLNSREIYLTYSLESSGYRLYMQYTRDPSLNFCVTVHVENRNRYVVPLSYYQRNTYGDRIIWQFSEDEIVKAWPDFLFDGLLIFLVTIDNKEKCYDFKLEPPIDIPMTIRQTVQEKSVQTPPYMNDILCLENLTEDLCKALDRDKTPGVVLTCGDFKLKVHKDLLCSRSEVFSAMLTSDMVEGRTNTVHIKDMDQKVFDHFVRYLKTGKLSDLTVDIAKALFEAADKYSVQCLTRRTANFLAENLDPENACELLALADVHNALELKDRAIEYILEKNVHLQPGNSWLDFCESHQGLAVKILNIYCRGTSESCDAQQQKKLIVSCQDTKKTGSSFYDFIRYNKNN